MSATLGLIDLQVALGLLVWITKENFSVSRAYIDPIGMLMAVIVVHMAVERANRQSGNAGVGIAVAGPMIALAIVILTIPHDTWS